MHTTQELEAARAALRAGDWGAARSGFEAVLRTVDDPLAYEGLAQAAWWLDDADTCVGSRERAYRRHRAAGDVRGAGRAATSLAWDALLFGHGGAVARGWLGRARELLAPLPECAEHGWLAVREAEQALFLDHDPPAALAAADRAAAVGAGTGVGDLQVTGLALSGLALTVAGDVGVGMARLDTAVAAATAGDVADLMWMGKVCCWLIAACQDVQDVERAAEWCRRVEAVCAERDLAPLFTVCRIEYASLQIARGTWEGAERELTAALERLAGSSRSSRLDAVVQLGELRRRQGRTAEADALFAQAEFAHLAVVGRALIRLDSGDAAGAWGALAGLLGGIPDSDRMARAAVLRPAVLTATAAGDPAAALACAAELRATADLAGTPALLGLAAAAQALVAAPGPAAGLWRDAVHRFQQAGLRFDEADARVDLAAALLAADDRRGAGEQVALAERTFRELSAAAGLARTQALAARLAPSARAGSGPLTARETQVLALVAQGLGNAGIAAALVISEHTVHRHVANILTKLGAPSRAAATALALQAGLLPLEQPGDPPRG